ncbi:Uncharacterised protein [Mycobacteroides abscessus subsp. abscessus]|nr:Uncharacterised protein [Mycobacteroides abscessus subsp. abscessus]
MQAFALRIRKRLEAFGDLSLLVVDDHRFSDTVGRPLDSGGAIA